MKESRYTNPRILRPTGGRSSARAICLLTLVVAVRLFAADPQRPILAESLKTPVLTNSLPANPDAAWKEIETASRPPVPPADWAGKTPSAEQREAFQKMLGEKSALVAAKAKEFYTRFPNHAKADEAKRREERFLKQALSFGNTNVIEQVAANLTEDQKLELKINEVHRRALEKHAQGTVVVVKEKEAGIRQLMKEYPDHALLWEELLMVARNTLDKEEQKRLLAEIVQAKGVSDHTLARAKTAIKAVGNLGHPLELSFTAADGRKVDVQKMKGKVVLIDFWAAWCGPCIQSFPEVVKLYEKYHDQGFEIVGINMDKTKTAMESVLKRFKMPWPQYYDGKGWGNKFALDYNVSSIPALWLVDKRGILRTMEARQDLEGKIKEFLAEQD